MELSATMNRMKVRMKRFDEAFNFILGSKLLWYLSRRTKNK